MINQLNQEATDALIRKSSSLVKSLITGSDNQSSLYHDLIRMHPLCGFIKELNTFDSQFWIGDGTVLWPEIADVRSKIQSFNDNIDIDLSTLPEGGTSSGTVTTPVSGSIVYRAGISTITTVGPITIEFMVGGALAPMPSTDYYLNCWLVTSNGTKQGNLGVITKTTNGFTASDVLSPGSVHYEAILLT
jgi:hypothetical protein